MFDYNTKDWAKGLAQIRPTMERMIWSELAIFGRPSGFLDLGCGDGWSVRTARVNGIDPAIGIELSQACVDVGMYYADIRQHDLTQPLQIPYQFDLINCLEVAEHLPESAADTLVRTIKWHARNWVVWTAAVPGQGGDGHINCQPHEYWKQKFSEVNMHFADETTALVKQAWLVCTSNKIWYPANVQVFHA